MIDLLSHYSKNIWNLAFRGCVTRLAEVLKAEPQLAKSVDKDGITPLWWLLDDEAKALDIVDLFLSHGIDPSLKNQEGRTAANWATTRGMLEVAQVLRKAAGE